MVVDKDIEEGRNTTILGIFSTLSKAKQAVNPDIRARFGAESAPIVEDDEEEGTYFLIQKFIRDVVDE